MCELCEKNNGEMPSCQDCGALICFDTEQDDDICAMAYVTASGDLFCRPCGRRYGQEDEEGDDGEPDFTLDEWEWAERYPELAEDELFEDEECC